MEQDGRRVLVRELLRGRENAKGISRDGRNRAWIPPTATYDFQRLSHRTLTFRTYMPDNKSEAILITSDGAVTIPEHPQGRFCHDAVSGSNICEACEEVEIRKMLGRANGRRLHIGWSNQILVCKSCSLCRLITASLQRESCIDYPPEIWKFEEPESAGKDMLELKSRCFVLLTSLPSSEPARHNRDRQFHIQCWFLHWSTGSIMGQSTIRLLDSDTHQIDKSTLFSGRAVDPSRANFNMARSWLQECDNEHDCLQRDGMKNILIRNLLVIDVERLCIVEVPYNARYVALSYVWPWFRDWKNFVPLQLNRSNLEEFKKPGYMSKMQSGLPNVIKDAFQAVRNLNETYIWIDALCIIQDDEVAKTHLVRRMDQIYGGAYLTIVAATSAEPTEDYSIPGVGITRKDQQMIETVDGLRFVSALPDYNDSLRTTRWVTRGWTFQEGLLSRRCLIFTEHQMYFRCTRDARCEDVNVSGQQTALCNAHSAKPNERLSKVDYLLNSDFLHRGRDADWFGEYIRIVSEFTKRNLTVESDVMSAFTGIMNRFSPYIEGTGFSAGLPFKRFEQSLLWLPTSASKRRTAPVQPPGHMYRFPSWSWAGWIGGVDYEIGRPGERPVIDQHLDLVQWFRWAGQSYGLVPVRDSWHLYNPPEAEGPRGYEFGRLVGHRSALEANTTLMISWVTSILKNLRLPEVHLVHWVTDWDQSLPCLIVEDQECLPCGFIVSADRTWAQRYKRKGGGLCELLLLSITGRSQDDLRNAELLLHAKYRPAGHGLPVYINVMLIEYGEDESDPANEKAVMSYDPQVSMEREHRIAYRRGIGLMHVESVNFQDLTSNDRKILILG